MTRSAAWIALVGLPNAGKSSLLNALLARTTAIVTHKAQTTRRAQAVKLGGARVVVSDTPGVRGAPSARGTHGGQENRALLEQAKAAASEADVVCFVLDASRKVEDNERSLQNLLQQFPLTQTHAPPWLVLNKIDKKGAPASLAQIEALRSLHPFAHIIPVSATQGEGVATLKSLLKAVSPQTDSSKSAKPLPEQPSDEALACELTRAQILLRMHDEMPYAMTVASDSWERKRSLIKISQTIRVARTSHKAALLGRGGRAIKALSTAARQDMEKRFGCRVHLVLQVRVATARERA